jgi:hypothetical protein
MVVQAHALRQFVVAESQLPSFLRRRATFGKFAESLGILPTGTGHGALEAGLAGLTGGQQQPLIAATGVPASLPQMLVMLEIQSQIQSQALTQAQVVAAQAVYEFVDWYSAEAVREFAQRAAQVSDAFALSIARQTNAYLTSMVDWTLDLKTKPHEAHEIVHPSAEAETGDKLRQGETTHAGVYGRIADVYRWQQHRHDQHALALATDPHPQPTTLQTPLDAAVQRAQDIAATDVQLAARNQAQKTLHTAQQRGQIIGYRRVIHPELDRGGVCGLCIAASTRIYRTDHLMPLHGDCHCTALPVTSNADPGGYINAQDLGQLYGQAGGTDRAALEHTKFSIVEHGENGPTLIPEGAPFRGPRTVRKATGPRPSRADSQARKQRQLTMLRDGLQRSLDRVNHELVPADPGTWADYRQTLADRVHSLDDQLRGAA